MLSPYQESSYKSSIASSSQHLCIAERRGIKKRLEHSKGHIMCVLLTTENFEDISPIAVEHTDFVVDCEQPQSTCCPIFKSTFLGHCVLSQTRKPSYPQVHLHSYFKTCQAVRFLLSEFLMACSSPEGKNKKKSLKAGLFLFYFLRLTHTLQFLVLREDTRKWCNSFFG